MTLKWNKEPYGEHEYVIELKDHKYSGIKFVLGWVLGERGQRLNQ